LSNLRLGKWAVPSDIPTKTLSATLPLPIRATFPAHLILLDVATRIIFPVWPSCVDMTLLWVCVYCTFCGCDILLWYITLCGYVTLHGYVALRGYIILCECDTSCGCETFCGRDTSCGYDTFCGYDTLSFVQWDGKNQQELKTGRRRDSLNLSGRK
jgi:hypothetical protein